MIKTAIQLKAKIRNISGSDSKVAMTMIRVFFMERFLERVSISAYKNQFVLKGGMLVSSLIGLNSRARCLKIEILNCSHTISKLY